MLGALTSVHSTTPVNTCTCGWERFNRGREDGDGWVSFISGHSSTISEHIPFRTSLKCTRSGNLYLSKGSFGFQKITALPPVNVTGEWIWELKGLRIWFTANLINANHDNHEKGCFPSQKNEGFKKKKTTKLDYTAHILNGSHFNCLYNLFQIALTCIIKVCIKKANVHSYWFLLNDLPQNCL